jgi:hypothetical protein
MRLVFDVMIAVGGVLVAISMQSVEVGLIAIGGGLFLRRFLSPGEEDLWWSGVVFLLGVVFLVLRWIVGYGFWEPFLKVW